MHRYDVVFNGNAEDILTKYKKHYADARVLFSAEGFCWPDKTLTSEYPLVKVSNCDND
jgi:procollagen-lysine,2-oxoglutarate 5-dioxygenase